MSSSLFLCSYQVRYASLPAPLRQPGRHADRLPPAAPAFVSRSLHRPPPLHWTGSGVRMISSCFVVKRRRRRNGIHASLFGVGAPEALVIGVVALLVFGPKGLAEAARSLGKTLRAFQPTIRELQDVSRDFKNTLEREIGLDEDPPSMSYRPPPSMNNSQQPAVDPDVKPETTVPYTSEELMKVTEEQLAASAIAAWNAQQPASSEQQEAAAAAITPSQSSDLALSGGGSDGPVAVTEESNSEAAAATTPSQSSDSTLSGGNDGPGAVTEESNSGNTENAKLRDEA
ncbi:sec-independent protein translocase protein TATB, chloroplastic-like isoform X1 [Hordeum vulgare subsp. vulgare]|uniref:Sec-independent protein translocase protein TATB, chloroplastic n=1 Tax=Hordeum vulgare subsp. vulgare TaxID=112509 RepID=A0A8I6YFE5_HORVV|nr:sec-independent protein translocase protein TATB, chloroplastic-like isoform X1 [Hordeum vulgare subsp. vulgare]